MALQEYQNYICRETQATELKVLGQLEEGQVVELNDYSVTVSVKKE